MDGCNNMITATQFIPNSTPQTSNGDSSVLIPPGPDIGMGNAPVTSTVGVKFNPALATPIDPSAKLPVATQFIPNSSGSSTPNTSDTASNYLQNVANFTNNFASYSEFPLVAAAKAGQAVINIPHNVTSIFSPSIASHIPYSSANMGKAVGDVTGVPVPTSSTFNTEANIGSALIPAVGESEILGNALKFGPGMMGDVTRYIGARVLPNAAIGAGFNSANPALGAAIGSVGAALGAIPDTIQNIINRFGSNSLLNNLTAKGIEGLKSQANDLVNQYNNGYGGLNSVADQSAITVSPSSPWDQLTQQVLNKNPEIAAKLSADPTLGLSSVGTNPDAVRAVFPQDWLDDFENPNVGFSKSSGVRKAFNAFTESPTLGNADNLKQAFNAVPNPNSAQTGLISQGKNFIKNNVIQPALTNIDPNLAQGYADADNAFAANSQIYKSSNALKNLVRGTTIDRAPTDLQSILKPIIENAQTPGELEASNASPAFSKLYNDHMNNIRNLYDSVSQGVDHANALNASYIGKGVKFLQRHPLMNLGAPLIRTAFQTKNALNSPGQ